jgi:hypothetical protein
MPSKAPGSIPSTVGKRKDSNEQWNHVSYPHSHPQENLGIQNPAERIMGKQETESPCPKGFQKSQRQVGKKYHELLYHQYVANC